MHIGGMQKLTLLDYPGKVACTVFLSGCNLRCPYCHNPGLVLPDQINAPGIPESEVFAFLEQRKGKLDGICITGGEPTLQPELPGFLEKLRELGYAIKLDTNGTYPGMLEGLLHDGILDYVAMDIKNSPQRYAETCGGADVLSRVRESVDLLLDSSIEYEFRTTVCKPLHTEKEMEEIETNEYYEVEKLTHSIPYLIPSAAQLLEDIGHNFQDSLRNLNASVYKIKVTSVTRTVDDVKNLKKRNTNSSQNSAHRYGTTFDVSWARYTKVDESDTLNIDKDRLKMVLAMVLRDLKREERCYVKHERKQGCFHITVREKK